MKDLYIRPDTIKLLEENIGKTLDIHYSKIFFGLSVKAIKMKTKINKWGLIKLKTLHSKGNHKQNKKTTLISSVQFSHSVVSDSL